MATRASISALLLSLLLGVVVAAPSQSESAVSAERTARGMVDKHIYGILPLLMSAQLHEASDLVSASGLVFDNLLLDKLHKKKEDPTPQLLALIGGVLAMIIDRIPTQG